MPHIHPLYDFVVTVFIVRRFSTGVRHEDKVLLVYHKTYDEWLPIGGHIELDEDPEQALCREIKEECGLRVRLFSKAPDIRHPGVKPIPTPDYVDVHRITDTHKHIAFIYFAAAKSAGVVLHEREHREFRWVGRRQLKDSRLKLTRSIYFYCVRALERAAAQRNKP